MKTERPPPPFVKTFHKIPVFLKDGFPYFQNIFFFSNCEMYLFKWLNVFVQIAQYIFVQKYN